MSGKIFCHDYDRFTWTKNALCVQVVCSWESCSRCLFTITERHFDQQPTFVQRGKSIWGIDTNFSQELLTPLSHRFNLNTVKCYGCGRCGHGTSIHHATPGIVLRSPCGYSCGKCKNFLAPKPRRTRPQGDYARSASLVFRSQFEDHRDKVSVADLFLAG